MAGPTTTQDSFFLTLPSNSSVEEFPDNTLTHFRVKLPRTVHLSGEYECALTDISFPTSWYNLITTEKNPAWSRVQYVWKNRYFEKQLKDGYYSNIEDLLEEIRLNVPEEDPADDYQITVMEHAEKILFDFNDGCQLVLTGRIARILGFESDSQVVLGRVVPPQTYNLNHIDNLFIYTDIVEHETVGNSLAPLLRVVNVEDRKGTQISVHYQTPHYKRVQTKVFDTIEIDIRDGTGESVPFTRGTLILTVHFRRKTPSYL